MARRARIVVEGMPHHIIQRGNRRQKVFLREKDKKSYLTLLGKHAKHYGLNIWSYCLMDNHVHLIVVPAAKDSLSKGMGETHKAYAWLINKREKWTGHLWEGRFKSFLLDPGYVYKAVRYVEMNPVRAKIVERAEEYKWSSAKNHIKGWKNPLLSDFYLLKEIKDWRAYLNEANSEEVLAIRNQIKLSLPFGSDSFIQQIELEIGRVARKLKPGPKSV